MFIGFADIMIAVVYISCILVAFVCFIYGLVNWNKGDEEEGDKWQQ
jgi:hypothetical protein